MGVSAKPIRRSPSYKGLGRQGVIPLTSSGSYGSLASGAPSPPPGRGGGGSAGSLSSCRALLFYVAVFVCGCLLTAFLLSPASGGGGGGAGGTGLEQSIVASSLRTASAKRGLLLGGEFLLLCSFSRSLRTLARAQNPHRSTRCPLYWAIETH
jgi:preprotein translocase subunit SecG